MIWVGLPVDVFQPIEFLEWRELWEAIERRCLLAGLEASAPRCGTGWERWDRWSDRAREIEIWVEVKRAADRRWKRLRRLVRNEWLIARGDAEEMEGE
jgi:hypothetical protein